MIILKSPFFPEELLIRIQAKLSSVQRDIVYENVRYSPVKRELYIDEKIIPLGEVQECLCHIFMNNIGNVLDKSILMDCLLHPSDTALRVALNKFKQISKLPIKNVRGVGYILEKS
jgi:DNA-binding response OmpR family regulator